MRLDKKRRFVLVYIVAILLLLPFVTAQPIGNILDFYYDFYGWIDLLLVFLTSASIFRLALGKIWGGQTGEESPAVKLAYFSLALTTSVAIVMWEVRNGYSLVDIGWAFLLVLFLLLFGLVAGVVAGKDKKKNLIYMVLGLLFIAALIWMFMPDFWYYIPWYVFSDYWWAFAVLLGVIGLGWLLFSLFKNAGGAGSGFLRGLFGGGGGRTPSTPFPSGGTPSRVPEGEIPARGPSGPEVPQGPRYFPLNATIILRRVAYYDESGNRIEDRKEQILDNFFDRDEVKFSVSVEGGSGDFVYSWAVTQKNFLRKKAVDLGDDAHKDEFIRRIADLGDLNYEERNVQVVIQDRGQSSIRTLKNLLRKAPVTFVVEKKFTIQRSKTVEKLRLVIEAPNPSKDFTSGVEYDYLVKVEPENRKNEIEKITWVTFEGLLSEKDLKKLHEKNKLVKKSIILPGWDHDKGFDGRATFDDLKKTGKYTLVAVGYKKTATKELAETIYSYININYKRLKVRIYKVTDKHEILNKTDPKKPDKEKRHDKMKFVAKKGED